MIADEKSAPRLCACGCSEPISPEKQFRRGHNSRVEGHHVPVVPHRRGASTEVPCPACGNTFTIKQSEIGKRTYCSRPCRWSQESVRKPDNPLKARVLGKMRAERLLATQVAAATNLNHDTLKSWLSTPDRRLQSKALHRMAVWLGITPNEAMRLQGGSAEERQRAIMLAARYSPEWISHRERLRSDPAYRRHIGACIRENREEKPWSDERRRRQSEAAKRYRARPEAHPLGRYKKTLRGRAHTILSNLRRFHSDWTATQIQADAIRRLMAPPYNVKTAEAAAALLAPKSRPRRSNRTHTTKTAERCRILRDLAGTWARTTSGRRADGFWDEAVRRVEAVEGLATPYYEELKVWWSRHQPRCPTPRLVSKRQKS